MINWVNRNYSGIDLDNGPSDQIILPGNEVLNRRIQFSLGQPGQERIYFYKDPTNILWNGNCDLHTGPLLSAIFAADLERKKYMNIIFTEGSVCGEIENANIVINSGGSGYISPPTVTITRVGTSISGKCPNNETATAKINGGQVVGITITPPAGLPAGHYYPPTITFSGGGGSGASATVSKIVGGASGCAQPPWYGGSGDIYHVIYTAYSAYLSGSLWGNNIVLRHEIAHNLGLCHTYLGGGCSANCNTSDPNFWDDVFGNPSNCPHNADWSTDAFDPTKPTPATSGKVTNNIVGGNKAQAYASPKQVGEMHRALSLKNIRQYVDPCTYTPLEPIIISKNETWDFDIRLYSDLIIQPGFTLDVACKITMPCNSKIHVMPGATLKMQNGAEIILYDNATFLVDQGGTLIHDNGIITLNGINTVLDIKGTLNLVANSTLSLLPNLYPQGNGFIKFSSPLSPTSNNIIAGANSQIILTGSGPTDKVLEITQESMYAGSLAASGMNLFSITNGLVALANNSRLNVGRALTLNNVKVTSISGSFNNHRGVHVYGQAGVSINNCTFEYGKYGIFKAPSGVASLTISNSIFRFCTTGLYSVGQGVSLIGCQFLNNSTVGWNAPSLLLPSSALNSTFINSMSGI